MFLLHLRFDDSEVMNITDIILPVAIASRFQRIFVVLSLSRYDDKRLPRITKFWIVLRV